MTLILVGTSPVRDRLDESRDGMLIRRPVSSSPPSVKPAPPPAAPIGSLGVFWTLIEPILDALGPRRVCEVGVEAGAFTTRLIAWGRERGCGYVGIDPAPDAAVRAWFPPGEAGERQLWEETSLSALPGLGRCDAYFLDGDHNFHTVRGELDLIAGAARDDGDPAARGPVVFIHDVAWPWGRRDMYYLPGAVPAEARQPWSETLGVALGEDALIDGGLRDPGRYAIALKTGGPRNGVLTAVEDFLAAGAGAGWEAIILPVAYGLAVLHRPADPALPAGCRQRLGELRQMAAVGGPFLRECEANYLKLYLYGEHTGHALHREGVAHFHTLSAYADLERAYAELLAHSRSLGAEYERLREKTGSS